MTPEPSEDALFTCIREVSENSDADIYSIAGGLQSPIDKEVTECVKANSSRKNVLVFLTTYGGNADVAYYVARCFREAYKDGELLICVFDVCKSAGTLMAIGASCLIMTNDAQLGPLDVQLSKPDEIGEFISGLTPVQSLTFLQEHTFCLFEYYLLELITRSGFQITTKTATDIATKLTTGMFQPVYAQLDPMRLGEYHRNMMIAAEYGDRLDNGNLKQSALKRLTHGYPSHSFVIDRREAASLFNNIRGTTEAETNLIDWMRVLHQEQKGNRVGTVQFLPVKGEEPEIADKDKQKREDTENETTPIEAPERPTPNGEGNSTQATNNNVANPGQPDNTDSKSGSTTNPRRNTKIPKRVKKTEKP